MENTLGVVLIGELEIKSSIRPEEISLLGKPVVQHSLDVLGEVCDSVHLVYAGRTGITAGQILLDWISGSGLNLVESHSGESIVILHDAMYPLLNLNDVKGVQRVVAEGAPAAAIGHQRTDAVMKGIQFSPSQSAEPPVALRLESLKEALSQGTRDQDLCGIAFKVADLRSSVPTIIRSSIMTGAVFSDMSLDEAEALLRVRSNLGRNVTFGAEAESIDCVLVLGGTGGIGQACIEELTERGVSVLAPKRRELDLQVESSFDQLSYVQAVIHTAASYGTSIEEIMNVNFLSCCRLINAVERKGWSGNILLLSSSASTFGRAGAPVYSASKAAVNALVEAKAPGLSEKAVRLNALAPAKVDTRLQKVLNPSAKAADMIAPSYIADVALELLFSNTAGAVKFVRKGQDVR